MSIRALTVTEFLTGINDVLSGVPALVEGEISGYSVSQGKWAFFSLKDDASVVGCFMPVWKLRHAVEDGMSVRVAGVSRVYEKNGKFSIVVEALEPVGAGSLKRAFELLKAKLDAEGLFAVERKRATPRFPECIGLIASGESAAYSDFLRILRNRWGGVTVLHHDVAVQGESAVREIVSAFDRFSRLRSHVSGLTPDVLVLTRGGGSLEDLQAFNSEEVARAIFACPIPVVVGVGHERDVTIADLVADVRASTPSNAAERVVPDRREIIAVIDGMTDGLVAKLMRRVTSIRQAIAQFTFRGTAFVRTRRERCEMMSGALAVHVRTWFRRRTDRLAQAERIIANLNPQRILSRGYSITTVAGKILRAVHGVAPGATMETQLAHGRIASVVRTIRDAGVL